MSDGNSLPKRGARDVTFFPLTVPITTGPGTVSVAIALAAAGPVDGTGGVSFVVGLTVAAALIAAMVWISDRYADLAVAKLGQTGANILMRLSAFVLLCVGVQIMITGVMGSCGGRSSERTTASNIEASVCTGAVSGRSAIG